MADQAAQYEKRMADLSIASEQRVAALKAESNAIFEAQLGQASKAVQDMQIQMQLEAQKAAQQLALRQQQTQAMFAEQSKAYQAQTAGLQQQLQQQREIYKQGLADLSANQRAFQINQARSSQTPELQIGAGLEGPKVGGTAPFKRRRGDTYSTFGVTPNLNLAQTNVLNV